MELVLGFLVGLVIGWNFLPQPVWIKTKIDSLLGKS